MTTETRLQHFRLVLDGVAESPAAERLLRGYADKTPTFGITFWAADIEEAQAFGEKAMAGLDLGAWHAEPIE